MRSSLPRFLMLLSLAGCAAPPDSNPETPEGILKKIRETVHQADVVKVSFESTETPEVELPRGWRTRDSGTLLLKHPNKVRLGLSQYHGPINTTAPPYETMVLTSDGIHIGVLQPTDKKCMWTNTPATFREGMEAALFAGRLAVTSWIYRGSKYGGEWVVNENDFPTTYTLRWFKAGQDQQGRKTLEYYADGTEGRGGRNILLRYQPDSFKLLELVVTWPQERRWTSTFRVESSEDVSDDRFTLPPNDLDPPRKAKAQEDLAALRKALDEYAIDNNQYPTTQQGLIALFRSPAGASLPKWKGPYIPGEDLLRDPWGHPYTYQYPRPGTSGYYLFCKGPESAPGTEKGFEK